MLAVTRDNVNAMLTFSFMVKVRRVVRRRREAKKRKRKPDFDRPKKSRKSQQQKKNFQKKQVVALMRTYFGGEFSEAAIRSNFVLVYELLDEVADHGWPQVRRRVYFLF